MPTACILARNEASALPACLHSLTRLPACGSVLLIDTGSTDTTPTIAAALGARVLHIPWRHDFASHRNEAAALAGSDWILSIDADEVLVDPGNLLDLIGDGSHYAAVGVQMVCRRGASQSVVPCMLRCHDRRRARWKYPYHNVLEVDGPVVASTAVIEAHYDERTPAQAEERLRAILAWRDREPAEAHHVFCATMAARTLGRWQDVVAWGADYLALAARDWRSPLVRYWRADALIQLDQLDAARQEVVDGLGLHPGFPDLHKLSVMLALMDWADAADTMADRYAGVPSASVRFLKHLPAVADALALPIGFEAVTEQPA